LTGEEVSRGGLGEEGLRSKGASETKGGSSCIASEERKGNQRRRPLQLRGGVWDSM